MGSKKVLEKTCAKLVDNLGQMVQAQLLNGTDLLQAVRFEIFICWRTCTGRSTI